MRRERRDGREETRGGRHGLGKRHLAASVGARGVQGVCKGLKGRRGWKPHPPEGDVRG